MYVSALCSTTVDLLNYHVFQVSKTSGTRAAQNGEAQSQTLILRPCCRELGGPKCVEQHIRLLQHVRYKEHALFWHRRCHGERPVVHFDGQEHDVEVPEPISSCRRNHDTRATIWQAKRRQRGTPFENVQNKGTRQRRNVWSRYKDTRNDGATERSANFQQV